MLFTKNKAKFLESVIQKWEKQGLISQNESIKLLGSFEAQEFNWKKLAKYSFWICIICIITAFSAFAVDPLILKFIRVFFDLTDLLKLFFFLFLSSLFFTVGFKRKKKYPEKSYSNEAILFLGTLSFSISISYLSFLLNVEEIISFIFLTSFLFYALIGYCFSSKLIWIFSLLTLGAWLGMESSYISSWGAYSISMNYPLKFVALGLGLTGASYALSKYKQTKPFVKSTQIIAFLYLFIALWTLSIFGSYTDFLSWLEVKQIELFHWSLLFAFFSAGAIAHSLKFDNHISKGFGITFLFINLYTRYFEFFWDSLHKGIFFTILGVSFWILGSKSEKIWSLGKSSK